MSLYQLPHEYIRQFLGVCANSVNTCKTKFYPTNMPNNLFCFKIFLKFSIQQPTSCIKISGMHRYQIKMFKTFFENKIIYVNKKAYARKERITFLIKEPGCRDNFSRQQSMALCAARKTQNPSPEHLSSLQRVSAWLSTPWKMYQHVSHPLFLF